jgi:hypothetical protein
VSDSDAHLLLDKMSVLKNLLVNVLVHEKDNFPYLLPDFEFILAKAFNNNGIETRKSAALILMKTFMVLFDPGGNTLQLLEVNNLEVNISGSVYYAAHPIDTKIETCIYVVGLSAKSREVIDTLKVLGEMLELAKHVSYVDRVGIFLDWLHNNSLSISKVDGIVFCKLLNDKVLNSDGEVGEISSSNFLSMLIKIAAINCPYWNNKMEYFKCLMECFPSPYVYDPGGKVARIYGIIFQYSVIKPRVSTFECLKENETTKLYCCFEADYALKEIVAHKVKINIRLLANGTNSMGIMDECLMGKTLKFSCGDLKWIKWVWFLNNANGFTELLSLSTFQATLDLLGYCKTISTFDGNFSYELKKLFCSIRI